MQYAEFTRFDVAGKTHQGRVRSENQDNLLVYIPREIKLLATKGSLLSVADGMGGHAAGKAASTLAIDALFKNFYSSTQDSIGISLSTAVSRASQRVFVEAELDPEKKGMGTTISAVVIKEDKAYIANVGDSRVYLIRDRRIRQLTKDHSMVREFGLDDETARNSIYKNQLTRALGIANSVNVDIFTEPLREHDVLVLCTDGLTNHVKDQEILAIAGVKSPAKSVSKLIKLACKRGGKDNITVIATRIKKVKRDSTSDSTMLLERNELGFKQEEFKEKSNTGKKILIWIAAILSSFILIIPLIYFGLSHPSGALTPPKKLIYEDVKVEIEKAVGDYKSFANESRDKGRLDSLTAIIKSAINFKDILPPAVIIDSSKVKTKVKDLETTKSNNSPKKELVKLTENKEVEYFKVLSSPQNNFHIDQTIEIKLNKELNPETVDSTNVILQKVGEKIQKGKAELKEKNTIIFIPTSNLIYSSQYQITLSAKIAYIAGNISKKFGRDTVLTFTTQEPPNTPPTITLTKGISTGPESLEVTFTVDVNDKENSKDKLQVQWEWGDLTTKDIKKGNETNIKHTYSKAGTYQLKVEVADTAGLTISDSMTVIVKSPE